MTRFYNPDKTKGIKTFWSFLKWKLSFNKLEAWPKNVKYFKDIPPARVDNNNVRISSVGHASFLIQHQGGNILTDPVWADYIGPFNIGIRRVAEVGIDFDKLPTIDYVLISHNHYDHLDLYTIKKLEATFKPTFIVPVGNEYIIQRAIPRAKIQSLNWYNFITFTDLKIHLIPSQHWSKRSLFDTNYSLWGGFIIETHKVQICFIGDSGYNKAMFQEIGQRFSNITFAIIPIGCYKPRWFMEDVHMSPAEAIMTLQDLKAKFIIPAHFGVFKLADDAYNEALEEYLNESKKLGQDRSIVLRPGEFIFKSV